MNPPRIRCAIYTRKSSEEGLEQSFNSLDAQRESAEAFIACMKNEGWSCLPDRYDDGGYSGGTMERPALKRLLSDISLGKVDTVVVYKIDRLSRSLMDFARMMELFQKRNISFVAVTQQFNTTTSMGRLTLNMLLSFAQFERELASERTRDKIAATRKKGKWSGGRPVLGYNLVASVGGNKLEVNPAESEQIRAIFKLYLKQQSLLETARELNLRGWRTKAWTTRKGRSMGGLEWTKTFLHQLLMNPIYLGKVRHKTELFKGEHQAILDQATWDRVQVMLQRLGRRGTSIVPTRHHALLGGLLRCTACDSAMGHTYTTSKTGRVNRYYACSAKGKGAKCSTPALPALTVESFVNERVKPLLADPEVRARLLTLLNGVGDDARRAIETELAGVTREVRQLQRAMRTSARGKLPERTGEPQRRLRQAEKREAELRDRLAEAEAGEIVSGHRSSGGPAAPIDWDKLNPGEQSRLLRLLVQRIDYDAKAGKLMIRTRDLEQKQEIAA